VVLTGRALGCSQFGFHHVIRVSTGSDLDVFSRSCLPQHAALPSDFRRQVGWVTQRVRRPPSRVLHGDQSRRDSAHFPIPPSNATANKLVVEGLPIGQHHVGHGSPVAVFQTWMDRNYLPERKLRADALGPAPDVLSRLQAVDPLRRALTGVRSLRTVIVSPSETPTTLPAKSSAAEKASSAVMSRASPTQCTRPPKHTGNLPGVRVTQTLDPTMRSR
jgi:hypothetical protein